MSLISGDICIYFLKFSKCPSILKCLSRKIHLLKAPHGGPVERIRFFEENSRKYPSRNCLSSFKFRFLHNFNKNYRIYYKFYPPGIVILYILIYSIEFVYVVISYMYFHNLYIYYICILVYIDSSIAILSIMIDCIRSFCSMILLL